MHWLKDRYLKFNFISICRKYIVETTLDRFLEYWKTRKPIGNQSSWPNRWSFYCILYALIICTYVFSSFRSAAVSWISFTNWKLDQYLDRYLIFDFLGFCRTYVVETTSDLFLEYWKTRKPIGNQCSIVFFFGISFEEPVEDGNVFLLLSLLLLLFFFRAMSRLLEIKLGRWNVFDCLGS